MVDNSNEGGPMRAQVMLILSELLFVIALLVGVGLIFVPAALILGGILGIVACELHAGSS